MTVTGRSRLLHAALAAAVLACVCRAGAVEISLPPESASYKPNALPGYQLVQRNCMTCHSAHYVSTQPPSSGRVYWEATVRKMKKPFGAQIDDADIAPMVDYLVKTYGAERTAAGGTPLPGAR
jgi:mono/diheme cytochrome c family protein